MPANTPEITEEDLKLDIDIDSLQHHEATLIRRLIDVTETVQGGGLKHIAYVQLARTLLFRVCYDYQWADGFEELSNIHYNLKNFIRRLE